MKTIHVKIENLLGSLHITSKEINADEAAKIKSVVTKALIGAVRDFEVAEPKVQQPKVQTLENTFEIIEKIMQSQFHDDMQVDLIDRALINYRALIRDRNRDIISSFLTLE